MSAIRVQGNIHMVDNIFSGKHMSSVPFITQPPSSTPSCRGMYAFCLYTDRLYRSYTYIYSTNNNNMCENLNTCYEFRQVSKTCVFNFLYCHRPRTTYELLRVLWHSIWYRLMLECWHIFLPSLFVRIILVRGNHYKMCPPLHMKFCAFSEVVRNRRRIEMECIYMAYLQVNGTS